MAEKNKKLVKVGDHIIAFPDSLSDERITAAIKAFRELPDHDQHTHFSTPRPTILTTEESEHARQIGNVPSVTPDWNTVRQAVYKSTEPTLPNPNTKPKDSSWGANRDAAWNAGTNALNVGGNVLKRAARFTFGVVDMPPQVFGIISRLFSYDENVSQQAESELLILHPGAQIADRMKEAVQDWRKSKSLATENVLGDILGAFLVERAGKSLPSPPKNAARWMGDAHEAVVTSGNVGKYKTYAINAPNGAILGKLNLEDIGNGKMAVRGTSVRIRRHRYGSRMLEEAIKQAGIEGKTVVVTPDEPLYPEGKALWDSLVRRGLAVKVGDGYESVSSAPKLQDVKRQAAVVR